MTGGHRRILVVEDDPETAGQLVEELTTSGYDVDLAATGREALSHGVARDYAVITIDRMLPDIDGIAVMRQLRDDGIAAPFLIISALGEVDDRVRGLRAGGDDYLVKPFSFVELLARLEALGRRSETVAKETSAGRRSRHRPDRAQRQPGAAGKFRCCRASSSCSNISSEPRPRRLPGDAAPACLGSPLHPSTNIIDVYVGRVRRKVDDAQAYPLIHTIRGIGYCIRAPG